MCFFVFVVVVGHDVLFVHFGDADFRFDGTGIKVVFFLLLLEEGIAFEQFPGGYVSISEGLRFL